MGKDDGIRSLQPTPAKTTAGSGAPSGGTSRTEIGSGVLFGTGALLGGYWDHILPPMPPANDLPPPHNNPRPVRDETAFKNGDNSYYNSEKNICELPPEERKCELPDFDRRRLLSEKDWAWIAGELGVEVALVKAIAMAECGHLSGESGNPRGFVLRKSSPNFGKPLIRIEPGRLRLYGMNQFWERRTNTKGKPYTALKKGNSGSWDLFTEIEKVNPVAAICSTSFGLFQLMGQEYLGYISELKLWPTEETGNLHKLLIGESAERQRLLNSCDTAEFVEFVKDLETISPIMMRFNRDLLRSYRSTHYQCISSADELSRLPRNVRERIMSLRRAFTVQKQQMSRKPPICFDETAYNKYKEVTKILTRFKDAMISNEQRQAEYFIEFVRKKQGGIILDAMRALNWARIARYYNGPGYRTNHTDHKGYDRALAYYYAKVFNGSRASEAMEYYRSTAKR